MAAEQAIVLCFRLASEHLSLIDISKLSLLSRYFRFNFLASGFKSRFTARLLSNLPEEIKIHTGVPLYQLLNLVFGLKNLLKNHNGVDNFAYWDREEGGSGWELELWMESNTPTSDFASSYEWCSLRQTVNLLSLGYNREQLEGALVIAGAVMYGRIECRAVGEVTVELTSSPFPVIATGEVSCPVESDGTAKCKVTTIVQTARLPRGTEELRFVVRGKDTVGWAGSYGARVRRTFLYVVPMAPGMIPEDIVENKTDGSCD